ncbi:hypothetical protein [Tahibacter amnicola]|uniref:Uncharacterized protein n=1 Tax=Tahibacter amnicola TaxID=2976241 RepID=A0ABY6BJL9_9GAMM|nr:hypothetical protein [Tahibacter amnicola]UXI70050.1 hypothetical protein N4264_10615 [Tahibacter amnicola]
MDTPVKPEARGSAKLFAVEAHDRDAITRAIGFARDDYQVKWWWKYGQPAIDLVRAHFEVKAENLGPLVDHLMKMNGPDFQVTAQCFPYGIPKPDLFRIEADIRNPARG